MSSGNKLHENKNLNSINTKQQHRVLILSDSMFRGIAELMNDRLSSKFVCAGIVSPNARIEKVVQFLPNQLKDFTDNDICIIIGGTNQSDTADDGGTFQTALHDIENFSLKTNIILCSVPLRYDKTEFNKNINEMNKKIKNVNNVFFFVCPFSREHFTSHGLHFSQLGKENIAFELSTMVKKITQYSQGWPVIKNICENREIQMFSTNKASKDAYSEVLKRNLTTKSDLKRGQFTRMQPTRIYVRKSTTALKNYIPPEHSMANTGNNYTRKEKKPIKKRSFKNENQLQFKGEVLPLKNRFNCLSEEPREEKVTIPKMSESKKYDTDPVRLIGKNSGKRKIKTNRPSLDEEYEKVTSEILNIVKRNKDESDSRRMFLKVGIKNMEITALLDSGASNSVIDSSLWYDLQQLGLHVTPVSSQAMVANGEVAEITGKVRLPITFGKRNGKKTKVVYEECYLMKGLPFKMFVGMTLIRKCGMKINFATSKVYIEMDEGKFEVDVLEINKLTESTFSSIEMTAEEIIPTTDEFLQEALNEVPEVSEIKHPELSNEEIEDFSLFLKYWKEKFTTSTGKTNMVEHKMILKEEIHPIKQKNYKYSPAVSIEMGKQVDELLAKGYIQPSSSPWNSPPVIVSKKDGRKRMCIDYRLVNKATKPNSYALPNIDYILMNLKESNFVSSLDLVQGYHQVPLNPDSRPLTAFSVPGKGHFEYLVLPFGLHSAPATFEELMDRVLSSAINDFAFVYLDDIIIFSKTYAQHQEHLNYVLQKLLEANLVINWKKSKFLKHETDYLGHRVGSGVLKPAEDKTKTIRDFPPPNTQKQVRSFLGLTGFYRKFIKSYALKAQPLNQLLHKDHKFEWTKECQNAFEQLKNDIIAEPVLICPDFTSEFEIQCDASNVALGAVLVQYIDGCEKVIAYASRTLSSAERNYTVTELECLAVLFSIEKFRCFIEFSHFTVVTDHSSLLWLTNLKTVSGRLVRWITRLNQYDFTIKHRKGSHMNVPDALSRAQYNISELGFVASPPDFQNITDPWYLDLINKVNKYPDQYSMFSLKGNVLFKTVLDSSTGKHVDKILVPYEYRLELLKQNHQTPPNAHFGIKKTIEKLSRLYYWPGLSKDVQDYILHCQECQRFKPSNTLRQGYMKEREQPMIPWQIVSLDLIGPLPRSRKNNKFILVVVELCTKWVCAIPLKSATTKAVTDALLNNVILEYGVPEIILTDNGTQLTSLNFHEFCKKLNIRINYTPRYFPQANPTERYNRTIKTAISMFIQEDDHNDWDKNLPYIIFALRTFRNETTGYSPAKLHCGRELRSFFELFTSMDDPNHKEFDPKIYDETLQEELAYIFERVKKTVKRAKVQQASQYNLRHRKVTFKVNDLVLKKNFPQSSAVDQTTAKLFPKFLGPYKISKVLSDTQYQLSDLKGKDSGVWPILHLKPYLASININEDD